MLDPGSIRSARSRRPTLDVIQHLRDVVTRQAGFGHSPPRQFSKTKIAPSPASSRRRSSQSCRPWPIVATVDHFLRLR